MNVAINGFGRIGRMVFRCGYDELNIVAINDLVDTENLAHLLKHDSVHGSFDANVDHTRDSLIVNDTKIDVYSEKNPEELPWDELNVDVVVESTGLFRHREDMEQHLNAGADKVVLSAPPKSDDVTTVVLGVNEEVYDGEPLVSNASCTTNCLAPLADTLHNAFGIRKGYMTTVHAYTSSQNIVDGPNSDTRRGRHAAENLVPTTTGAADAVGDVIPELDGRLDGMAVRAPVPDGSLTDFTAVLDEEVSVDEVNDVFAQRASDSDIVGYTEESLVSRDIIGNEHSCIVDAETTRVNGNMVKLMAWYDNEYGYSQRMVDLVRYVGE